MVKLILITTIIIGIAVAGFAIKMFIKKDGEFKKSCSSADPTTGKKLACTCHNTPEKSCDNSENN
jgi:hypothetical protein